MFCRSLIGIFLLLSPVAALAAEPGHNGKVFCAVTADVPIVYPGVVLEVLVSPGDTVEKGTVLARYRPSADSRLQIAESLSLRQSAVDLQCRLLQIEKDMADLAEQHDSARRLTAANVGSAEAARRLSRGLAMLREQKALLLELAAIENSKAALRLATLEKALGAPVSDGVIPDMAELVSPLAGEVLRVDSWLRAGQETPPLPQAVSIGGAGAMLVRTQVFEAEIIRLAPGGGALVQIPAQGNREYAASIIRLDRTPTDPALDRPSYYEVTLAIHQPDARLRQGFKAVILFDQNGESRERNNK